MKMRNPVHPGIKKALFTFIVVFAAMITLVVLSNMYMWNAEEEHSSAKREMRQWRSKIDQANRNNQILVSREDAFKELKERSVIGDEDRLSWVEAIHRVTDRRNLSSIKYDISSQEMIDRKKLDNRYSGIDVFRSVMTLDMELLHEGDLVALFSALKQDANGLFAVDECRLENIEKRKDRKADDFGDANIRAYCKLSWYTLKKTGSVK